MKFYAEPNLYVRFTERHSRMFHKKGFYFDEHGEFETEHPSLVKLLKLHFKYGDEPKNAVIETENNADTGEIIKLKHCKKCDFTCENMGDLLAHYRKEHAKGDNAE